MLVKSIGNCLDKILWGVRTGMMCDPRSHTVQFSSSKNSLIAARVETSEGKSTLATTPNVGGT